MRPILKRLTIADWAEPDERFNFVTDLRDLGLQDAHRAHEIHRASACTVYQLAGPVFETDKMGKREQAAWIL